MLDVQQTDGLLGYPLQQIEHVTAIGGQSILTETKFHPDVVQKQLNHFTVADKLSVSISTHGDTQASAYPVQLQQQL